MQRRADQLIGHARAVVLGGVDVIDAELHRAAQDGDGRCAVARRTEYPRTWQLHRAEANARHGDRPENMTSWLHAPDGQASAGETASPESGDNPAAARRPPPAGPAYAAA